MPGVHSKVNIVLPPPIMKIGELAQATGFSRDTLRFYEKLGLLQPVRTDNGYRHFPAEAVDWLCYLRTARELGFSLAELQADLPALRDADDPTPRLREMLRRKLGAIDARIEGLRALRRDLQARLDDTALAKCPLQGAPAQENA